MECYFIPLIKTLTANLFSKNSCRRRKLWQETKPLTLSLPLVNISDVKEPDNFLCTLPGVNYNSPKFFRRDDPRRKSSGWHYPARLELGPGFTRIG